MSHWQKGKLSINCSDKLLIQGLERIHPEWVGHIQVAPQGEKLTAYDYYGHTQKADILVPSAKNKQFEKAPGIVYSDLVINRSPDGWEIVVDDLSDPTVLNLENPLQAEIQKMKEEAMARFGIANGMEVIQDEGGERRTRYWIDRDKMGMITE